MISRPEHIAALGNIVTVWAHPDDETYLAAGIMAVARDLGASVTCVIVTDGDFAASDDERATIGRTRLAELSAALDELDVHDVVLLHLPDGGCVDVEPTVAIATISQILADRAPHTIITFGPDGLTGHADHRAVGRWTTAAAADACPASRVLHTAITADLAAAYQDVNERFSVYEAGLPNTHARGCLAVDLLLCEHWLDMKVRALRCHRSQTAGLIEAMGVDRYRGWVEREQFVDAIT